MTINARILDSRTFLDVVDRTPLVSIDLLVQNDRQQLLLGLRNNEPACGFWFVPGGRICKDETLAAAFTRITANELGVSIAIGDAQPAGVFEHFYNENFARKPGISTHYIVLAYRLNMAERTLALPEDQHSSYRWASASEMTRDESIHRYTRDYAAILK